MAPSRVVVFRLYEAATVQLLIRSDGEFSGAEIRIGGKLVQPFQIVARHADDAGAGGVELFLALGKGMGFQVAALPV